MIDFDDIETKELKDEQSRREEEEERQRTEQALRFKWELMLEQEVERRCQVGDSERVEEQDGILGVRLTSNAKDVDFVDGLNDSLLIIGRQFAKHRSEYPSFGFLQRGLAATVAFLNALLLCRFSPSVVAHCEQLVHIFTMPKSGLCALLQNVLATPPEVKETAAWQKLGPRIHQLFSCLGRMIPWVTTRRRTTVEALENGYGWLKGFFEVLTGPVQAPEWPVEDSADAVEVSLRWPNCDEEVRVRVRSNLTVEELKHLLVECWHLSPGLKLCGQTKAKTDALPSAAKMRSISRSITVLDGGGIKEGVHPDLKPRSPARERDGAPELAGEAAKPESSGSKQDEEAGLRRRDYAVENVHLIYRIISTEYLPVEWLSVAGCGWVPRWHVLRTTPITATRLLHELRTQFQAVEFQERYKELRMRMRHIDCALQVQQRVLPAYGFADTITGVNDMRGEVTVHEMHYGDKAVEKLRREIHGLLEYGEPPRKMPVTRAVEAPRFRLEQRAEWLRHLADEGYAVIADAASRHEVETAYGLLWDFIETSDAGGVLNRQLQQTWFDSLERGKGWPAARDDGIIHSRGIGQSKVLWYLRSLASVKAVFAEIWGTEDLVTSFDGAGVFRPYGQVESWRTTKKNWFHVDQTHRRRGLHCVQGLLNMKEASRGTGGLVVVPRSHRFFGDVLRRYEEAPGQDSLHLDVTDPVLTEGESGPRLVCAAAGDLLIWDSRTVHCNTPPLVDDTVLLNSNDLIRAVAYICMTPAAWCTKEVAEKRKLASQMGITTTHVPHDYRPMDVPERFPSIQLSGEQHKLVGSATGTNGNEPRSDPGRKPGCASFLPAQRFAVDGSEVPVRGAPTTEWGGSLSSLVPGSVVTGHRFGEWLRLSSQPAGGQSAGNEEEWVPMKWNPDGRLRTIL